MACGRVADERLSCGDVRVTDDDDRVGVLHIVRLALVVAGLAAAMFGAASLTGGWLGTPPWWNVSDREMGRIVIDDRDTIMSNPGRVTPEEEAACEFVHPIPPRPDRERISVAVVVAGVAVVTLGAWPRRRDSVARDASGRG